MDDTDLVRETAAQFVAAMGARAVRYLEQQADIAAGIGDLISEAAWLDIAVAAKIILDQSRSQLRG